MSENGKLLAWVARDPQFESREQAFNIMSPEQRAKEKKPAKHRFPVDFHRGVELFGQQANRLGEPGYREMIARSGVILVEGFNVALGLDAGKVTLLFDADDAGDGGAKEALWLLTQRSLDVRLGWSRAMHVGAFKDRQPAHLKADEWEKVSAPAISR